MPGGPFFNCYPGPFSNVRCSFLTFCNLFFYSLGGEFTVSERRCSEWTAVFTGLESRCSDCGKMGSHRLRETLLRLLFRLEVFGEECIDGFEKQGTPQRLEFFGIAAAVRI